MDSFLKKRESIQHNGFSKIHGVRGSSWMTLKIIDNGVLVGLNKNVKVTSKLSLLLVLLSMLRKVVQ